MHDPDGDIIRCRWAALNQGECGGVCNAFPNSTLNSDTVSVQSVYVYMWVFVLYLNICDYMRECVFVFVSSIVFACALQDNQTAHVFIAPITVHINTLWWKQHWTVCGGNSSGRLCKIWGYHSPQQCSSSVCGQCSFPKQCKHTMWLPPSHFHSPYTTEWNLHSCIVGSNMERNIISSEPVWCIKVKYKSLSVNKLIHLL